MTYFVLIRADGTRKKEKDLWRHMDIQLSQHHLWNRSCFHWADIEPLFKTSIHVCMGLLLTLFCPVDLLVHLSPNAILYCYCSFTVKSSNQLVLVLQLCSFFSNLFWLFFSRSFVFPYELLNLCIDFYKKNLLGFWLGLIWEEMIF